ncbi:MAG: Crp/Fnr family transcriptional regulator [Burkholderiaceae bacterium]|jgi:CRP-like cAMP-binding protein|nr:Crp/Fnr family transcriptional regulator [Burkholderiaceae bacterium]
MSTSAAHTPSSFALRRIALFDGLADASLDRIAADCEWRPLAARQPVFSRCSTGSDVFFLVSGRVRITTYSPGGREVSFRDHGAGEHFGDLAAIDGHARSTDVVTLESSLLASLTREDFLALLAREPAIAMRVMVDLAGLVRRLTDRVMELSTQGVPTRLHAELLRLAQEAGVAPDRSARLDPAPSHATLASKISTNREQVTRELGALTRRGLLRKEGRQALLVTDVQALRALIPPAP